MPRKDKTEYDPRESAGIMNAIPKRNLERIQRDYGSQSAFAEELSRCAETTINRQTVNGWIRGKERMSNRSVILVSHVLGVSPLYILDLCSREDGSDGAGSGARRYLMLEQVEYLQEWKRSGVKPKPASNIQQVLQFPDTPEELEKALVDMGGDYRDPYKLACDIADWYVQRCRYINVGKMISQMTDVFRACVP